VDESDDDARARVTEGVPKGYGTTIDVNFLRRNVKDLLGNTNNHRESFVYFDKEISSMVKLALLRATGRA